MPVRTTCPHCEVAITFLNPQAGEQLTCPRCGGLWVYGAPADRTGESGHSQTVSPEPTYKVACPKCAAVTKLPRAAGGHVMTCKRCAAQVVLPDATAIRNAATTSGVEAACQKCSRSFSIDPNAEFEWTECPSCSVVVIARPKAVAHAQPQPLPPPLPANGQMSRTQPAGAGVPPWNQEQTPDAGQSRRISRWVGALVLLTCLTVAVLIGVSLRDAGQATPWAAAGRGEDKATSPRSTTGLIEEKAITGRDLVTFLKECGVVKNHVVIPPDEIVRKFRLPATGGWGLLTNKGVVFLFEFEAEVDARVSPIWGCQIGSVRLALIEASEGDFWSYCAAINALQSPEADARLSFSDETKARLRNEVSRIEREIRRSAEAERAFEGEAKRWEAEMKKHAEHMREEMKKRMERK